MPQLAKRRDQSHRFDLRPVLTLKTRMQTVKAVGDLKQACEQRVQGLQGILAILSDQNAVPFTQRILKIDRVHRQIDHNTIKELPGLRIKGEWLYDLGFMPGQRCLVVEMQGMVVLMPILPEEGVMKAKKS